MHETDNTLPLTVHNTGFLLERMARDCHPLQFLRELTQNSIEAIRRTAGQTGEIVWDVDWTSYDLDGTFKLSVIDNGDGMTGQQMVKYINQLSASLSDQSLDGNYGVGAKIAAATRNPAGLIYMSWANGAGSMIHLWRDSTGQYGLRQIERPGGTFGHYGELENDIKPSQIDQHGTVVILLGKTPEADTMTPPEGTPSASRWIAKYLNSRYFSFPPGITVRAREGWEHPRSDKDRNLLRRIMGQQEYLNAHSIASGVVELSEAEAHWWVLKDESALSQNSGFIESSGHVAALHNGELYELATARSGRARLQQFGVLFGHNRVVVYVRPIPPGKHLTTNTARTQLLIDSEPLPWADYAADFRERMPEEIQGLMDEVAAGSKSKDHSETIRERLKAILSLFKVSRYRPTKDVDLLIDEPRSRGGKPRPTAARPDAPTTRTKPGGPGGAAGGVYSVFLRKDGVPGRAVHPDVFPVVQWVSVEDQTRNQGDIEDRAARFLLDQNVLQINADFRVFADMVYHWTKEVGSGAGVADTVQDAVRNWFEQTLVETVIGVQALKDSKEWSIEDIEKALSEEALTTAVMQRYHVNNAIKRELSTKLGKLTR